MTAQPFRLDQRAIARIQRLSCLGLGGQIAIPALLRELHALIPSDSNEFYWAGPKLELTNMYLEGPDAAEVVRIYLLDFHSRPKGREHIVEFPDVMRARYESPAGDFYQRTIKQENGAFVKTDGFDALGRPLGKARRVHLKVTAHGKGLGALTLNRNDGRADFTSRENKVLERIAPFVAHALGPAAPEASFVESDDRAILLVDADGKIVHRSREAGRLLLMATRSDWSPSADFHADCILPEPLRQLCAGLVAVFEDNTPRDPPVWRCRNGWGVFEFRPHLLEPDVQSPSSSLIAIDMQRREPLALRLLRRMERLPLSNREIEFCLLTSMGYSRSDIAERMGVTENTAITHGRNVYAKLGVSNRVELLEKLRAA